MTHAQAITRGMIYHRPAFFEAPFILCYTIVHEALDLSGHESMNDGVVWLIVSFGLLLLLTRWIARHVQGIGYLLTEDGQIAIAIYMILTLPGVLLHELSHALAALLLRVKVRRFSIGIQYKRKDQVALGSVDIARTDPIRASLIGLAPLVTGCATILLIGSLALGLGRFEPFSPRAFWRELPTMYRASDFWLWVYLVFAVGNAMFPSAADRHAWWLALIFIAFVGVILYFAGLLDELSAAAGGWAQSAMNLLTYAFAVTAIVDVFFGVLLFLIEQSLGLLGFGRIKY